MLELFSTMFTIIVTIIDDSSSYSLWNIGIYTGAQGFTDLTVEFW